MGFIRYVPDGEIDPADDVPDRDNIIRIHSVHGRTMRHHYDLYVELMHRAGPLRREQREMIAVVVSGINGCRY